MEEMTSSSPEENKLVKAVQAYALANWHRDGWDMVHEAMDADDILEAIDGSDGSLPCATEAEAIDRLRAVALDYKGYSDDIRATAF
jgi:hypothetical protein